MWPDDYSSPGIEPEHPESELAAFALHALDDAEFQAVFHHVIKCLHCQEVLLGFQETAARLTEAAPEVPLPPGLKRRVLAAALGDAAGSVEPPPALPPADPRWSLRRLRRWLAPAAIGALSLLLAASIGFMVSQQREINHLAAANEAAVSQPAAAAAAPAGVGIARAASDNAAPLAAAGESDRAASPPARSAPAAAAVPLAGAANTGRLPLTDRNGARGAAVTGEQTAPDAEEVNLVKQEMADVVEATVMSVQPETEKLPMTSPMGTAPEAKGVLMVDPNGRHAVLMVSGMPADTYQILLVRAGEQLPVGRIVVNEADGSGVAPLELDKSVFEFREVALLPDERNGPTNPTGEKFLSARIIQGPPVPPAVDRRR